jgi:hypothetical protein
MAFTKKDKQYHVIHTHMLSVPFMAYKYMRAALDSVDIQQTTIHRLANSKS